MLKIQVHITKSVSFVIITPLFSMLSYYCIICLVYYIVLLVSVFPTHWTMRVVNELAVPTY